MANILGFISERCRKDCKKRRKCWLQEFFNFEEEKTRSIERLRDEKIDGQGSKLILICCVL